MWTHVIVTWTYINSSHSFDELQLDLMKNNSDLNKSLEQHLEVQDLN